MGTKSEGAFYLWTEQEVDEVLGPSRAPLFKQRYYVKPEGNADLSDLSDPHDEFQGKNCLIARKSVQEAATTAGEGTSLLDTAHHGNIMRNSGTSRPVSERSLPRCHTCNVCFALGI